MGEEEEEVHLGKACYFHRDLTPSTYGSDVFCLQNYLNHQGFLSEEPSGYYGPATEVAVYRWQDSNKMSPPTGMHEFTSRVLFAKNNKLPTAEELLALEVQAQGTVRTCLDVICTNQDGGEVCQTVCLKRGASDTDKLHVCEQACQVAAGEACDKWVLQGSSLSQSIKYKRCLSRITRHCKHTCADIVKKGSKPSE